MFLATYLQRRPTLVQLNCEKRAYAYIMTSKLFIRAISVQDSSIESYPSFSCSDAHLYLALFKLEVFCLLFSISAGLYPRVGVGPTIALQHIP
mmetsp:Transcript_20901/g.38751  ORF Transcript_20901/g.38751 Transcript_20901/m.38751 type:complete len:93 (-) Transcript_20901:149-427(-)